LCSSLRQRATRHIGGGYGNRKISGQHGRPGDGDAGRRDAWTQDHRIARIEPLGGRVIDDRRQVTPGGWVVMADPGGNEFDLEDGE
jgi:hypothetical protein